MIDPLTNADGTAYHSDEWWSGYAAAYEGAIAAIPKDALVVSEERLREALRQIQIWPADGDYAAVIFAELRKVKS